MAPFAPTAPGRKKDNMTQGRLAWDPATGDPLWIEARYVDPPTGIKEMLLRFELAREGDLLYLRRTVTQGVGGMLWIKRKFDVEMVISDTPHPPSRPVEGEILSHPVESREELARSPATAQQARRRVGSSSPSDMGADASCTGPLQRAEVGARGSSRLSTLDSRPGGWWSELHAIEVADAGAQGKPGGEGGEHDQGGHARQHAAAWTTSRRPSGAPPRPSAGRRSGRWRPGPRRAC